MGVCLLEWMVGRPCRTGQPHSRTQFAPWGTPLPIFGGVIACSRSFGRTSEARPGSESFGKEVALGAALRDNVTAEPRGGGKAAVRA